jgi:uroporphyrinogen-III synthase
MSETPLAGKGIVVTRPARQAERLAALIRDAGGAAILYPVIEIRDVDNPDRLNDLITRLDEFDLAVFVSPNAAARALGLIRERRTFPARLPVAAVGPGTARELARFGVTGAAAPAGRGDSETLLALPELAQPQGRRVVIFRGDGGRELLADELTARGALVEYATCYRRARPDIDPAPLLAAWAGGSLAAFTVTSSEGLRNLCEMVGPAGRALLARTPIFVTHPRIGATAEKLGLSTVLVTAEPGDEGLLAALVAHFSVRSDSYPSRGY